MQSVHKQLLERIVSGGSCKVDTFVLQLEVLILNFSICNSEIYSLFLLPCEPINKLQQGTMS